MSLSATGGNRTQGLFVMLRLEAAEMPKYPAVVM